VSPTEQIAYDRIRRRAANLAPDVVKRLLAAYDQIRVLLTESELARAINSGTLDRLLDELIRSPEFTDALSPLREQVDRAVLESGRIYAGDLPSRIRPAAFNVLNPRVIDAARALDTRVLQALSTEVRETVRQAVISGTEQGANARVIARDVRASIGLSPNQEQWVRNFRAQLETGDRAALRRVLGKGTILTPGGETIQRAAHAGGAGLGRRDLSLLERSLGREQLTPAKIDAMTASYRKRLIGLNAEAVTRSVALDASRAGQRLSWEDAIGRGILDRTRIRRVWLAVGGPGGDGRNRPEHLALHGTEVGFDERYPNGDLLPGEGDYGCRCGERIYLKPAAMAA